jgi:hypothetical protein
MGATTRCRRRLGVLWSQLAAGSLGRHRDAESEAAESQAAEAAALALVTRLEDERATFRRRVCDEARELQREPLFTHDPVIDQEQFQRDGVIVLEGIYTEAATRRLTEACKSIQKCNDAWVNKDWLESPLMLAAWRAAGLRPPTALGSPELRAQMTGGTQLGARDSSSSPGLFDGSDFRGLQADARAPFLQGFCPEAFACGYDPMLLNAYTHPQMLALQRQMLGPDLRFDHCLVFNRKAGFEGGGWHTHAYSEDGLGLTTRNPLLGEVRNLLYPEGFGGSGEDGDLSVVRGGHLYRDDTMREANDAAMDAGWLASRRHPITGRPLVRERLALPPGSLVAALTHVPHYVGPRRQGVRYAALLVYANPDHTRALPWRRRRRRQRVAAADQQEWQDEPLELSETERQQPNFLRRSATTPTTHADSVPVEWQQLAAAGQVPGVAGLHSNLFTEEELI